jgi:RNA polymerase sigma-70 factor (ECF subfamily)
LRALGCEHSLADDLTQETFLAVLQRPLEYYGPAATAAYLRTVARNLFITHQRRNQRAVVLEDLDHLDAAWQQWHADENGEQLTFMLRDCLTRLTERARKSLQLRFESRATRSEIASALEITEHGAKNLMQRAKQQLRDCIESKLAANDRQG